MAARTLSSIGCVVAILAVAGGSTSVPSASAGSSTRTATARTWSLVTLGDSVPRGTNCRCTPYPRLVAERLRKATGRSVTSTNESVAGSTTANVLTQVTSDEEVIGALRRADAVEIELGANDVAYSSSCGTAIACYAPRVAPMKARLSGIVRRIHALTAGRHVEVVLLDYWSIWLGGAYAAARGPAYVAAAKELTSRVDAAIRSVAGVTGSGYVDLRAAFKGPSYAYDETHYLSNDGDHPNATGHRRIAIAAETAIRRALRL